MSFRLRPYQSRLVESGLKYFRGKSNKPSILVSPVGSGKSIVISEIASSLKGDTVVFQPRESLLRQNVDKINKYGINPSICSASMGQFEVGELTYSTIGTAVNRLELFNGVKNVIIDECHFVSPANNTMYKKFLNYIKADKVLGLTATPFRTKTSSYGSRLCVLNRTKPKVFKDILEVVQIKEMVQGQYWAEYEIEQHDFGIDSVLDKEFKSRLDYSPEIIKNAIDYLEIRPKVVERIKALNKEGYKNILVFCKSLAEVDYYLNNIEGSVAVSSENNKKENNKALRDFESRTANVLVNCEMLTTGYDCPQIDAVVFARPTRSFTFFYQMFGRGIRIHPEGKPCLFVDFVNNVKRFGDLRDFKIELDYRDLYEGTMKGNIITSYVEDNPKFGSPIKKKEDMVEIMPIGKYRDKPIKDISDKNYLTWFLGNVKGYEKTAKVIKKYNPQLADAV